LHVRDLSAWVLSVTAVALSPLVIMVRLFVPDFRVGAGIIIFEIDNN